MGLLKAGLGAMGGVLADQWRNYSRSRSNGISLELMKGMVTSL